MRILVTADLHYDIERSRAPARRLARKIADTGGDVLVLVGDTAGADLEPFRECLELFADFPGRKLLVPGNHCLWCREGESSLDRYEKVLPELASEAGFSMLDHEPVVLGRTGLVGSIGWYDYSFRDESLGIPQAFYRAKVSPGAASYYGRDDLLAEHGDRLTDRQLALSVRWMDGVRVRLGMTDEQFVRRLAGKLRRQLEEVSARSDRIIVFMHQLPFRRLVPENRPDRFAFAAAYMGAECFGEILLAFEKVTDAYCGHSHWRSEREIGHINVVNIGSTYVTKRLEVLEI